MISGFCHEVDIICALLGCYTAYSGNSLPTFQDNLSVLSSRVKQKTLVRITICCVTSQKSATLNN